MDRKILKLDQINLSKRERQYHTPFHFDCDNGIFFPDQLDSVGYKIRLSKSDYDDLLKKSPEKLQEEVMLLARAVQQILAEFSKKPRWATRNAEFLWNQNDNLIFEIENDGMRSIKNENRGNHDTAVDLRNSHTSATNPHIKIYHRRLQGGQMTDTVICQADAPIYPKSPIEGYKQNQVTVALYLRAILRVLILRKNRNLEDAAQVKSIRERTNEVRFTMRQILHDLTSELI